MMHTFGKIRAPRPGRGKATMAFDPAFYRLDPDVQVSLLDQIARQIRDTRDACARNARIKAQHEDAANARLMKLKSA